VWKANSTLANYVIQGDLDRSPARNLLRCPDGAQDGEVGLFAFPGQRSEAQGIARLVHHLIIDKQIPPQEVLILVRSDNRGQFTQPIKDELQRRGIQGNRRA
jgi:superfamily I DNA/RNA helicase